MLEALFSLSLSGFSPAEPLDGLGGQAVLGWAEKPWAEKPRPEVHW